MLLILGLKKSGGLDPDMVNEVSGCIVFVAHLINTRQFFEAYI